MKKIWVVLALCALFSSCNTSGNNTPTTMNNYSNQSDSSITSMVQDAIMSDRTLSASASYVNVSTENGVVTLSGNVANRNDMNKIVSKTKNVSGVKGVNNQMTVSIP